MTTSRVSTGWPVNSQGEIILTNGSGNTTPVGTLSENWVPVDDATGGVAVVGLGGSSSSAPLQLTASRTALASDNGLTLYSTSASVFTYTIPSTGLPAGFGVAIAQQGTGKLTVAAGSGVTLTNTASQFSTSGTAGAMIAVTQITTTTYSVNGQTGA